MYSSAALYVIGELMGNFGSQVRRFPYVRETHLMLSQIMSLMIETTTTSLRLSKSSNVRFANASLSINVFIPSIPGNYSAIPRVHDARESYQHCQACAHRLPAQGCDQAVKVFSERQVTARYTCGLQCAYMYHDLWCYV